MSQQLPIGWAWTTLNEIVSINPTWWKANFKDEDQVAFVPMAAVEVGSGRLDASATKPWREAKKGFTRFQEGDVLVAKITPSMENGKAALAVNVPTGAGVGSTEFHVLRAESGIDPKLILFFVLQQSFRQAARASMKGVAGQLRVPPEFISKSGFALPPSNEQLRIVAEIEKQFTRLDAAVASLRRVQANLKRYRAAVLKAACEGRLVETEAALARAEQRRYEPAAELLQRILRERRARWEADQLAKMEAAGKPPKDDKWKTGYVEPIAPDLKNLQKPPEGWVWATIDQLSLVVRGASPRPAGSPKYFGGEIPWITVGALTADEGVYLHSVSSFVTEAGREASRFIEPQTLLLTNSGATLGVPKITLIGGCINDGVAALLDVDYPTKLYLHYFLKTQTKVLRAIDQGAAQPNLNTRIIKNILVPLPPIEEQKRIVADIERRISVIDELVSVTETSLKRAESLRQKVLQDAFTGKLVEQDPQDEPASKLLERIRVERARREAEEREKRQEERKTVKKTGKTATGERRKLVEVLREAERALKPKELFDGAGFKPEEIEAFYEELKSVVNEGLVDEDRPNNSEVYLSARA